MAEPVQLAVVRARPNDRIVEALEQLLARAKAGEVRGVVMLVNVSPCVTHYAVGETTFTDCITAFEDWKFCELANRNLHRTGL